MKRHWPNPSKARRTICTSVTRLADWVFRCLLVHSILSTHFAFKALFRQGSYWPRDPVAPWDFWTATGLGQLFIWIISEGCQRLGFKENPIRDHTALFIGAVYTLAFLWPVIVRLLFVPFCQQAQTRQDLGFQSGPIKPNKPRE